MIRVRDAVDDDAEAMSRILSAILQVWKSDRPDSPAHVQSHYIAHPDRISCAVAVADGGGLVGFQSLKVASEGNPYGLTIGWGIIGTYVDAASTGMGVGRALFSHTVQAAREAGLSEVDATIGRDSPIALAYYEAMGFRTYAATDRVICKKYVVT